MEESLFIIFTPCINLYHIDGILELSLTLYEFTAKFNDFSSLYLVRKNITGIGVNQVRSCTECKYFNVHLNVFLTLTV